MHNQFDSIIFDMDGTLWDAVGTYTKAWNIYLNENGFEQQLTKEHLDTLMGLEEETYLEKAIPFIPKEKRSIVYKKVINLQYNLIEKEGGKIYPGVVEGLEKLSHQYKLFIVSNCPEFTIDYFIKWSKIKEFIADSIAHGSNFNPKFENILLLKQKHNLLNPVYVGDTDSDRKQSKKADIPFVFMEYGFGKTTKYFKKYYKFSELVSDFSLKN